MIRHVGILTFAIVFAMSAPVRAQNPEPSNFSGRWESREAGGQMVLQQTGNRVTGTYTYDGGTIEGVVTGNVLSFRWSQLGGRRAGTAQVTLAPDGRAFNGTFVVTVAGAGSPVGSTGAWNGQRIGEPPGAPVAAGPPASFAGRWESREAGGEMVLQQTGNRVMGTYTYDGGTIDGVVTGNVLAFGWNQLGGRRAGTAQVTLSPDGRAFTGTFVVTVAGGGSPVGSTGAWNGRRLGEPAAPPPVVSSSGIELGTNRFGGDYRSVDLPRPDPALCQAQCNGDGRCQAWTMVNPGFEGSAGSAARCWLKSTIPNASRNPCCASGVSVTWIQNRGASTGAAPNPADIPSLLTGLPPSDRQELSTYVLTPDVLRRILNVNATLAPVLANDAALRQRIEAHARGGAPADRGLVSGIAQLARHPEIVAAISRGGMTTREYVVSSLVLVMAALTAENVASGSERMPGGSMAQNIAFVNARPAEMQRYGEGMEQMVRMFSARR